jgi:hypothetical protein
MVVKVCKYLNLSSFKIVFRQTDVGKHSDRIPMNKIINTANMKKEIVILVSILLFVSGCLPEESPLSDIEITDPGLISPSIAVIKNLNYDNDHVNEIEVWLYDKNKNSVELKGGEVRVNDQVLSVKEFNITKAPYYLIKDIVEVDAEYLFEIELSDGEIYSASIKSPNRDLKEFNLPANYNHNNDMNISWKDTYQYDEMKIGLNRYFSTDTSGGQRLGAIEIESEYYTKGQYTISNEHFDDEDYKAIIELSGFINGQYDDRFGSETEIYCKFSISKEIEIN